MQLSATNDSALEHLSLDSSVKGSRLQRVAPLRVAQLRCRCLLRKQLLKATWPPWHDDLAPKGLRATNDVVSAVMLARIDVESAHRRLLTYWMMASDFSKSNFLKKREIRSVPAVAYGLEIAQSTPCPQRSFLRPPTLNPRRLLRKHSRQNETN